MLFTSLEFIFLFLPLVLLVNFLLPTFLKNLWLLIASLFFYAWGEPSFVLMLMLSVAVNYIFGLLIDLSTVRQSDFLRKSLLALNVLFNIGFLFAYKYLNFVSSVFAEHFPDLGIKQTALLLPIGISFYTFQALSYVIDVYRGGKAQKNFVNLAMYISLFPQLIAGPIVRYSVIEEQLPCRVISADTFSQGVRRFLLGFNKKMLLANAFAVVADEAFASAALSVGMAWLGAVCYSLQIFFDFAAYSEMAIGLGLMLGFSFPENFNYPYISATLSEFWRRWHMTLGAWLRDYLYFPLGGARVASKSRLIFNLTVVWLFTGIWHGANWTFIVWGILHGVFVIFEKLTGLPAKLKEKRVSAMFYRFVVLLVVVFAWVIFRADSLAAAGEYIRTMLRMNDALLTDSSFVFNLREYSVLLAVGLICSTPVFRTLSQKLCARSDVSAVLHDTLFWIVQLGLFLVGISYLVVDAYNPFIYFNF